MNESEFRVFFESFVDAQKDAELRGLLRQCLFNVAVSRLTGDRCFVIVSPSLEIGEKLKQEVYRMRAISDLNLARLNRLIIYSIGSDPSNPLLVGVWGIYSPRAFEIQLTPIW